MQELRDLFDLFDSSHFTEKLFQSFSDLVFIHNSIYQMQSLLVNINSFINALVVATRVLKHAGVLLESLGKLRRDCGQLLVSYQGLVKLTKGRVEVSYFFDYNLVFEAEFDCLDETHVGLNKSGLSCGQAKKSHHSPRNRVAMINDVGLTDSIFSLCELSKLE